MTNRPDLDREAQLGESLTVLPEQLDEIGERSALTCPSCNGVLWRMYDERPLRYRCHTGHAFSSLTLEEATEQSAEDAVWGAIRAVHERISEQGLTVAEVAGAIGISERYVHKLFERAGTTFSGYVMDRRLDGAARDLSDAAKADQTIGSIAFDWGFSDLSHFTRRFKQRFGCRPRDWRAR